MQKKIYIPIIVALFVLFIQEVSAQVAINTNGAPPAASAMLDVDHPSKGVLIPRVALTGTNSNLPIGPSVATGLLVYNTFTSNVISPFPVVPGFYYWNGSRWIYVASDRSWSINGNGGTTAGANFIGTTDNIDVVFKRNFVQSGLLNNSNNNTSWGVGALNTANLGTGLTAIGNSALQSNNIGTDNTAIGNFALQNNTDGMVNTAVGKNALQSNVNGNENTALGYNALKTNTAGGKNIGIGYHSLYTNATGNENTAIGHSALYFNNTGSSNTATGVDAMYFNTTGDNNTATGYASLNANTTGIGNTAFGWRALRDNTISNNNTAVGNTALLNNTGQNNTSIGVSALQNNTTGNNNTGLGDNTLISNTVGSFNTAVGSGANTNALNYDNTTTLGAGAVANASNQVRIGNSNVLSIGGFQNWSNVSDERFKNDVSESLPGLEFIKKLRPVTYHLNTDKIASFLKTPESLRVRDTEARIGSELRTGFIAQEVEKAALDLGFEFSGIDKPKNANDYYGLRYAEFTVPLVKAVQEQQGIIEKLQTENNNLTAEITEMKKDLNEMKTMLRLQAKTNNQ